MAQLVIGPLLRYVGETDATIWVETDSACEVTVRDARGRTFEVEGHHYALVRVTGLEPGVPNEYTVDLDGETRWPEPSAEFPRSSIRTIGKDERLRIHFGSCRVSLPHEPPYCLKKDEDERGREIDALYALALRMRHEPVETWPDLVILLGDQVYADEASPGTREFIRSRRDPEQPPCETVADFQEYTHLYLDAWNEPTMRWLLSTVSSAMIFDDHDVHDDWNTSQAWVEEMRKEPWWHERIVGGFMSYWIYQHIGNLSPAELADDEMWAKVTAAEGDVAPMLREFAEKADRENRGSRWSYCRDLGRTRLVVMDSRAGRILEDDCRRMVDDEEWRYIEESASGDFDHVLLATSLPIFLGRGMHHLEAWNEAICDGAWGSLAARLGEKLRQGLDLEHWAAFEHSFGQVTGLMREVGAGKRGKAPATIVALSGDVHHAYLADVAFRREAGVQSAVYQAVCSPIRNPLDSRERHVIRAGISRPAEIAGRTLARAAGVSDPNVRWRFSEGPWFDNQVASLDIDGRSAVMRLEKTVSGDGQHPELELVLERSLS